MPGSMAYFSEVMFFIGITNNSFSTEDVNNYIQCIQSADISRAL